MFLRMCLWISVAAFPALLCAQRGARPWWDSSVTRDLNLTDAQTRQVYATVREFRGRMFDLREAAMKAESELKAVFNEDPVDQRKASEAIERLAATRSELTKANSQLDLKLRTILTAQQWQELQKRQPSWPDRPPGRRRGPGLEATAPEVKPATNPDQKK